MMQKICSMISLASGGRNWDAPGGSYKRHDNTGRIGTYSFAAILVILIIPLVLPRETSHIHSRFGSTE